MLYERWRNVAVERRHDLALHDLASGQRWTFAQLFDAGEAWMEGEGELVCPQGHSPAFVFSLLSAWRTQKIACLLDVGQTPPDVPIPPRGCIHLKWTSATTGAARLIAFTAEQLAADAAQIVGAMGLRPDWPNLGVVSLAHSYGFSNLALPLLLHGIPLLLAPSPLPEIIRRAAASEPSLTLAAVPTLWRAWHEAGGVPSQVRLAISAGAPLALNLEQAVFDRSGIKIHNFYGSSECGGIAYDSSLVPRRDAALAGGVMPGVNLAVSGEGCLTVCSRSVGETYWPQACDSLIAGQFQSSDLVELNDGLVFLRGRMTDRINVAGRKVAPETIERALLAHPRVRECLVFGAPSADAGRTEMIVAIVVSGAEETALKKFLLDTLPAWQVPRCWRFVQSLPTGPLGKISRAEWRRKFSD
jgi:acyl-coenzyme A synthetase/AMP-(fatty) acid ligase